MKKLTVLFMSLMLIFGLAACGGNDSSGESGAAQSSESTMEAASGTGSAGTGKTLVAYYSASGNTEAAASYIAKATNGELFQLEPEQPYSDADLDWTDESSRVVKEHENPDERNVKLKTETPENWDSYDTIFIGYAGGIIGLN